MLRRRIRDAYSNRTFVLFAIVVLLLILGGVAEYSHRHIDLMDALGLAELRGRSILEIIASMDASQSAGLLIGGIRQSLALLPAALLNALPALVALAVIPWLAAHFVHALYDTKDVKEAHDFVHRAVFGMQVLRPIMIIKGGRIAVGEGTLYDRVGGSGFYIVHNDSAAVVEKGGQFVRVIGPSLGFLKPFERIYDIVDLRRQRWPLTVDAMTKDGIPVSCEAHITFKIDDRFIDDQGNVRIKPPVKAPSITDKAIAKELEVGIEEPLPYTEDAVFRAATSTWVRIQQPDHEEQLRRWTGRVVIGEVEGTLRNILARYRLDWLMRPYPADDSHPREKIRQELEHKLQTTLPVDNQLGAQILEVELGQIKVQDTVARQWVDAWQAGWQRRAVEARAEGEAELISIEAARFQAQAEMVITLAEAIRPLVTSKEELDSYQLAMRFIETLRWMSYNPWTRSFWPPEASRSLRELEDMLGSPEDRAAAPRPSLPEG
jgi:regulator of protease activity HflC (stomatin/prohibitin superfamily)